MVDTKGGTVSQQWEWKALTDKRNCDSIFFVVIN